MRTRKMKGMSALVHYYLLWLHEEYAELCSAQAQAMLKSIDVANPLLMRAELDRYTAITDGGTTAARAMVLPLISGVAPMSKAASELLDVYGCYQKLSTVLHETINLTVRWNRADSVYISPIDVAKWIKKQEGRNRTVSLNFLTTILQVIDSTNPYRDMEDAISVALTFTPESRRPKDWRCYRMTESFSELKVLVDDEFSQLTRRLPSTIGGCDDEG